MKQMGWVIIHYPKLTICLLGPLCGDYLNFDSIKFTSARLPFDKDFPNDYKAFCNRASLMLSGLKKNHLLKVLLMKHIYREKHAHTKSKLKFKLEGY